MKITLLVAVFCAIIAFCSSAQYHGDAQQILDASQGVAPDGFRSAGHPRGHAKGRDTHHFSINSLQDYSRDRHGPRKSGFKSRHEQDRVVDMALHHQLCQSRINALNHGSQREVCTVPATNTIPHLQIEEWSNGRHTRTGIMRQVTIVMGHFQGQRHNPRADVHIHTAYPSF